MSSISVTIVTIVTILRFVINQRQMINQESENTSTLIIKESEDDFDSEEQRMDEQARIKRKRIRKLHEESEKNKKTKVMAVGAGFGFDLTDYFDFSKDSLSDISGSYIAWMIVLYAVCNSAMIPPWIMNIKANKFLRISWRFLMQSLMMIPFMLYEYRTGNELVRERYKLSYIFEKNHIRTLYITSLATTYFFTTILTLFEWTYISHCLVLGTLNNLFLSLYNILKPANTNINKSHEMEIGGQLVALIGITLVMGDSYSIDTSLEPGDCSSLINPFYLGRQSWQRVLADLGALSTSFVLSFISKNNPDPKSYMPPYLSMLITHFFVCVNMSLSAFFFNGATFDMHPNFGVFAIFSQQHFTGFLYMSIILGLGLFLSSVMIARIFDEKLIPALVMIFDPIICTLFLRLTGVQCMPGTIATLGYVFIIPGMFLVIVGQNQLDKQVESQKKKEEEMLELNDLNKQLQEQNQLLMSRNKELTETLLIASVDKLVGIPL